MAAFINDLEGPIRSVVDRFFSEAHLTVVITYRLYQGHDSMGEDSYTNFPLTVIPSRTRIRNTSSDRGVPIRTGHACFIVRDVDLPPGVTVHDLSTNDRIVHPDAAEELVVASIDKTLGFVVELRVGNP
ncbi:MAG: hypothetical protein RDU20_22830 [Desulfomonilaceae bacterium]|nr:hypothetical protein [Desulfomonilaceae bacterium]